MSVLMVSSELIVSAAALTGAGVAGGIWLYRSPRVARPLPDRLKDRLSRMLEERCAVTDDFFPVYLPAAGTAPAPADAGPAPAKAAASRLRRRRHVVMGLAVVVAGSLLLLLTGALSCAGRPPIATARAEATTRSAAPATTPAATVVPAPVTAPEVAERPVGGPASASAGARAAPATRPTRDDPVHTVPAPAVIPRPSPADAGATPATRTMVKPAPVPSPVWPSPREVPAQPGRMAADVWFGVQWPDDPRLFAEAVARLGLRVFIATGERIEHEVRFTGTGPQAIRPGAVGDDIWPVARDLPRSYVNDGTTVGDRALILIPVTVNEQWLQFKDRTVRDAGGPAAVAGVVATMTRDARGGWHLRVAEVERRPIKQQ